LKIIPYVNPITGTTLEKSPEGFIDPIDGTFFPVRQGIPRFCIDESYTDSFGFQWNQFAQTESLLIS